MDLNYPLPLNGLRNFYWAAKLNSFKLAAETLHVSEAAVSQQIRNLENVLNVKLFRRGHQQVNLTSEGTILFPYIESAFKDIFAGVNRILDDPDPNHLAITTMPSFASHWLIARLADFYKNHPNLTINIDTSVEPRDFDKSHYDLAIRYGSGSYAGLESIKLLADPTILVCHPSLIPSGKIQREDLQRLRLIRGTFDAVNPAYQHLLKFFQLDEKEIGDSLLLHDVALGVEAVRSSQGISLQRLSLVSDFIDSGQLIYAENFAFNKYAFYAVGPEHHFRLPKVQQLLKWLQSQLAKVEAKTALHRQKLGLIE